MAGTFIEIEINDKELQSAFDRMEARCGRLKPAMDIIGNIVTNSIRENFVAQGRPERWKPLSEVTLYMLIGGRAGFKKTGEIRAAAKRKVTNKQILIDMGMAGGLMGSIHYNADDNSVIVGTDKVYGAIHQFGGKAGRNKKVTIPARPFIVVQDEDMETIKTTINDYLSKF
jgi:phage virion morphogenesis protein